MTLVRGYTRVRSLILLLFIIIITFMLDIYNLYLKETIYLRYIEMQLLSMYNICYK